MEQPGPGDLGCGGRTAAAESGGTSAGSVAIGAAASAVAQLPLADYDVDDVGNIDDFIGEDCGNEELAEPGPVLYEGSAQAQILDADESALGAPGEVQSALISNRTRGPQRNIDGHNNAVSGEWRQLTTTVLRDRFRAFKKWLTSTQRFQNG